MVNSFYDKAKARLNTGSVPKKLPTRFEAGVRRFFNSPVGKGVGYLVKSQLETTSNKAMAPAVGQNAPTLPSGASLQFARKADKTPLVSAPPRLILSKPFDQYNVNDQQAIRDTQAEIHSQAKTFTRDAVNYAYLTTGVKLPAKVTDKLVAAVPKIVSRKLAKLGVSSTAIGLENAILGGVDIAVTEKRVPTAKELLTQFALGVGLGAVGGGAGLLLSRTADKPLPTRMKPEINPKVKETINTTKLADGRTISLPTKITPESLKTPVKPKIEVGSETVKNAPKSLQTKSPLHQEALKYKSAEEFVKAQPTYYRGQNTRYTKKGEIVPNEAVGAIYGSTDKAVASEYGDDVLEFFATPQKVYQANDRVSLAKKLFKLSDDIGSEEEVLEALGKPMKGNPYDDVEELIIPELKKQGYDAIRYEAQTFDTPEIVVFDPKQALTKSQLTSIWEEANKPVKKAVTPEALTPKKEVVPTEKTPQTKPSGVAKQIEAKAIEKSMVEKGYEDIAGYDASTIKAQSELASKYTPEQINRIAVGDDSLPTGMKPGTALSIAEDYALKNNDTELIRKLLNSPLATEISESASTLSLSRMRDTSYSPVAKAKEIMRIREAAVEKKLKGRKVENVKKEIRNSLEKKLAKASKPSQKGFIRFIEDITC